MKRVMVAMGYWLVLLWGLPGNAVAGDYKLPDTGQNRCYDNSTETRCPDPGEAFYGQDAQHAGPQPAFQDNGDGTVTDLNTGLMWEQGNSSDLYWNDANVHCDELSLANQSDWRIPTRGELFSIVDYGYHSNAAAIDETYFPGCHLDDYWSSSNAIYETGHAWCVNFSTGTVRPANKNSYLYANERCRVRCVRAGY